MIVLPNTPFHPSIAVQTIASGAGGDDASLLSTVDIEITQLEQDLCGLSNMSRFPALARERCDILRQLQEIKQARHIWTRTYRRFASGLVARDSRKRSLATLYSSASLRVFLKRIRVLNRRMIALSLMFAQRSLDKSCG